MNICTYVHIYICICLVCLGRLGLGGLFFHFILGSNLGGVGPVRGLRGEGRGGWCEELAADPAQLARWMAQGAEKARGTAMKVMARVRAAVGTN